MTATQVCRRAFDPTRDARRHAYLLEGSRLYEVVGVRGAWTPGVKLRGTEALALLDVGEDLPKDPFAELDAAPWFELARCRRMLVVETTTDA